MSTPRLFKKSLALIEAIPSGVGVGVGVAVGIGVDVGVGVAVEVCATVGVGAEVEPTVKVIDAPAPPICATGLVQSVGYIV